MNSFTISLPARDRAGKPVTLDAPSMQLALIAADINLSGGAAEVWQGEKMLARLHKQPGTTSALWYVNV